MRTGMKWTTCARMHERTCSPFRRCRPHRNVLYWGRPELKKTIDISHSNIFYFEFKPALFLRSKCPPPHCTTENRHHLLICPPLYGLKLNIYGDIVPKVTDVMDNEHISLSPSFSQIDDSFPFRNTNRFLGTENSRCSST